MELKNIFKMTKTDRYTQDGRDELAKLQETEDVKYKTGDISQKTGLQKQPDGSWAPPKGGAAPKMGSPEYNEKYGLTKRDVTTGKEIDRIYEKHQKRIKELKAKGYTDEQIENDKIYQQTKEDMKNVGKSKPAEETKTETTAKFETEQENARYEEGKKGWETVNKERLPDIKKKVEQKIDYYKKYDPYAMLGKRTGLNAAQKKTVELNMAQAKENLAFFTGQLEGINEQMGATDSAPRELTGDCKIRIRK